MPFRRPDRPELIGHRIHRDGDLLLVDNADGRAVETVDPEFEAFSADGSLFLTGGQDGRIGLCEGASGELIGSILPGTREDPISARFVGDCPTD